MTDKLGRSFFFIGIRKTRVTRLGEEVIQQIWAEANVTLAQLQKQYRNLYRDSKMMVLPASSLLGALHKVAPEHALPLLTAFGRLMGEIIRMITSAKSIRTCDFS